MGGYRTAAFCAIAVTSLFAAGCMPSAGPPADSPVRISLCGGSLRAQPDVVNVMCANNSITARNLHWSGWGKPVATATGSAVVDLCAYEDCYAGEYVTAPIVIIASKIMRCPGSAKAYSKLQYVFVGQSPFAGLPKGAAVPDGSATPSGLGNQTLSLIC